MFKKSKLLGKLGLGKSDDSSQQGREISENSEIEMHPDAHEEGGLSCNNLELLRVQQRALTKWVTSMGQRLLSGNINLINTPFPVDIFEPRSYLEKLADVWVHPQFLNLAAASQNPVDRLNFVVTWFLAGLQHCFATWRKPFNPILGETWQASLSDGSSIFMEQISHHPPVTAFSIEGPGSSYRFSGFSQPKVSLMLKNWGFQTTAKGTRTVEFADGTKIDIQYPAYCMKGVVYSNRPKADIEGKAILTDAKNGLKAVIRFGSHKGAKGFMKRSDAVMGEVYDIGKAKGLEDTSTRSDGATGSTSMNPLLPPVTNLHSRQYSAVSEDFESASETDWELRDNDPEPEGLDPLQLHQKLQLQADEPSSEPSTSERRGSLEDDGRTNQSAIHEKNSGSMFNFNKMTGFLGLSVAQALEEEGTVVSRFEGSWLSHVDVDRKRYWTLVKDEPDRWMPTSTPLPSDSRFRQDLAALASGENLKEAQAWKEKLELVQRNDKKLREANY